MLEFVDSDLYFVQDKNNFINPLLQVGSGSGSVEKSTGSGSGGPKITGSDRIRIRILIPGFRCRSTGSCCRGRCRSSWRTGLRPTTIWLRYYWSLAKDSYNSESCCVKFKHYLNIICLMFSQIFACLAAHHDENRYSILKRV